jgi:O-antigen/teichoic acid export membrane protein
MAAISLLATVHLQADKWLVSKYLPLEVLGYYGVASIVVSKLGLVTSAMAQAALPAFSALVHADDRHRLMAQYRKLQDLLCMGTLPILAAIPFAAVPLFTAVLNAEAATLLVIPVTLLCVGTYLNGTLNMPYVVSLALGKPEITSRLNLLALVIVLPVTAFLIWRFGLVGAGLSWVVYHLFAYGYVVPRIAASCLHMPASAWYRQVLRMMGMGGLTFGIAGMAVHAAGPSSIPLAAASYTGALLVFLLGASRFVGDEARAVLASWPQRIGIRA